MKFEFCFSLVAIECDGTTVNTGHKNEVIVLLEKHLKRPLQWCVCLLHVNELAFRHLFSSLDGTTTGPNSFSGSIGKRLDSSFDFKIEAFEPILTDLPDLNTDLLSTNQKYLYQMCSAISASLVSPNLAIKGPGKLTHSRWLTCANRIFRLYIGTADQAENLKELANFIMKAYAPPWFDIKTKSSCEYENILLAMLQDDAKHIRELALRKILKARKKSKKTKVREFKLPELKIDASSYHDSIDWAIEKITEPPLTMKYSEIEISNDISSKCRLEIEK
ncbi:hypothetical protein HELRODRAFT_173610 [Helobdella robusta]|uniref:Uncharacterized protein n=1 Tax=Helobdella robusta TaxID=6412 RepID=T1F716_HELRO|nr:hypothetical protein HELRODRAFT_173610 [Helobdella robusta]ESO03324.1 hypothetical protein HELRODRAFT_173610 [Helobdella robusta]